jgi:hypothetical protein
MNDIAAALVKPFSRLNQWFFAPADARSYAAFRIAVALSALGVWLELWPMRAALFSSHGLFGPSAAYNPARINIFALGNRPEVVDAAFICAFIAIVSLMVGTFNRISAVTVYVWTVSYSNQAAMALAGYDTVLRLTTFALAISPTVGVWSVRPWWFAGPRNSSPPIYGLRLMQWQLLLIYWCTVWLKAPDQYWRRGETISYMLMSNFARFPTPSAASLGLWDPLLTWGTLVIELLVPLLLWQRTYRFVGLALGFALHAGIALTAKLGLFSLAMAPLYLAFLEPSDWERMVRWWSKLRQIPRSPTTS